MLVSSSHVSHRKLTDLPVELLAEVYLFALDPSFPHTCKYIYAAVKTSSSSIHAHYILGRHQYRVYGSGRSESSSISGTLLTRALRYPICTIPVLKAMLRILGGSKTNGPVIFELPRRIFRNLGCLEQTLGGNSEPLPFLRFLFGLDTTHGIIEPLVNSHDGYPLVRAVHARFTLLIRFLLERGADPAKRDCLAVKVAIGKKDLSLVKMLIEFEPDPGIGSNKKRRRADRVDVQPFMLDMAVRCDARDIVQYFMQEKGCVPPMKTLKAI